MILVPGTSAKPASAALPVSPLVAVRITISFLTLFFLALFVFAALTTLGMLIDYGKITGQAAETIEKYLGYVKPFGQGGAVRTFAKDITLKIFHFFDDLLGLKK